MAFERIDDFTVEFAPGPVDVHVHPRIEDARIEDVVRYGLSNTFEPVGKAGLPGYTEVALQSGITAMLAMPNEQLCKINPADPETTILEPYPVSNRDRVLAIQGAISHEAVIPTGIIYGLDPSEIFVDDDKEVLNTELVYNRFQEVDEEVAAIKFYFEDTTGHFNVHPKHAGELVRLWHMVHPEKPSVMHVEGANVTYVLSQVEALEGGKDIPVHIAHVSSREELEAVIEAKERGMNVTCEVTLHHLTLAQADVDGLGNYGCVKPGLKTKEDIDFIWAHIDKVDVIASDCAPHTRADKDGQATNWGLTGHTFEFPILLGFVQEGKITLDDLYRKMCVNPRRIFNLLPDDGSSVLLDTRSAESFEALQRREEERYGYQPYSRVSKIIRLGGRVLRANAGNSSYFNDEGKVYVTARPSYHHLIQTGRPVQPEKELETVISWHNSSDS